MNPIGFDLRLITEGVTGGMTQLVRGVLRELFALYPDQRFVVFSTLFNRSLLEPLPPNVANVTLTLGSYYDELNARALQGQFAAIFRSYPVRPPAEPMARYPLRRQVFLIPDIQHEYFPQFFTADVLALRRAAFDIALGQAGAIGTISEYARQTLLAQPATRCRDIFLMPPALQVEHRDSRGDALTPEEAALVPRGDYFLFPANLWPHKNHRRALEAFALLRRRTGRDVTFLFTGHPDGWDKTVAGFEHLPVRHLGFVRPALLRQLLIGARALVYFSLYEGFGMPLLEAFDAGTPVLCSDTTSLPEVGGDAVLCCDPTDVAAMSGLMERVLAEPDLRAHLSARGRERLKAYTWEKSARSLYEAFRRVAGVAAAPASAGPRVVVGPEAPLVSIVTPSFNQGRFLKRTIDSVLAQTYPRVEYVVVDGGSTDESLAILKSYGDRFAWISEKDRGQTHAINKGFARTRGSIRAYLNSDDVLHPEAVERVVGHFERHPDCDMLYGAADYIDENDRFLGEYKTAPYSFERLMEDCCVCQPAAFWRTRIAEKVGPFDERLHYAMDYDYWIRIDRAGGRIEHLPELLAYSRVYADTKTMSARWQIYREILDVCLRGGGYVSKGHVVGLWHHRIHEAADGWPRHLRRVPRFLNAVAHLHWTWLNRGAAVAAAVLLCKSAGLARRVAARGGRAAAAPLTRQARRLLARLRPPRPAPAAPARVVGFYLDNWIAPTLQVLLRPRAPGQPLRLAGVPIADMALRVRLHDRVVGTYDLRAGAYHELHLPVPAGHGGRLTLEFTGHHVDAANRALAFHAQDTNLFAEQDLN